MLEDNPSESVYLGNDYMWMLKPGHERLMENSFMEQ